MTVRSAVENQMQHQKVLSCIFVQLFYIYFILVIRHPDDGHSSGLNILVKDNSM